MAGIYAFPKTPLADVTQDDLHKAYERCERLAFECCRAPNQLRYLLDCADPQQTIYLAGGLDEAAELWMAAIERLSEPWPALRRNVELVIERGNANQNTCVTITLGSRPRPFRTAHTALNRLGQWLINTMNFRDLAVAKECLALPNALQERRDSLAEYPTIDLEDFQTKLSHEWRNACEWLSKQPAQSGSTPPAVAADLISRDDILLLVGGAKSSLASRISEWGGADKFPDPCSYAAIRPYLLDQWSKKAKLFPANYQELREIIAVRRDELPSA